MKRPTAPGWYVGSETVVNEGSVGPFTTEKDATMASRIAGLRGYLVVEIAPPELPSEPTLGWVDGDGRCRVLAHWDGAEYADEVSNAVISTSIERGDIESFVPATAVPTEALDKLRCNADCSGPTSCANGHVRDFLAAVDEANRA